MSANMVSWDHIGALVEMGRLLKIDSARAYAATLVSYLTSDLCRIALNGNTAWTFDGPTVAVVKY